MKIIAETTTVNIYSVTGNFETALNSLLHNLGEYNYFTVMNLRKPACSQFLFVAKINEGVTSFVFVMASALFFCFILFCIHGT